MADYNVKINIEAQAAQRAISKLGTEISGAESRIDSFGESLIEFGFSTKKVLEITEKMSKALKTETGLRNLHNKATRESIKEINAQIKATADYEKAVERVSAKYNPLIAQQQKAAKLFNELTIALREGAITSDQFVKAFDKQMRVIDGTAAAEEKLLAITIKKNKALQASRKALDPLFAAQRQYKKNLIEIEKQKRAGNITTRERLLLINREKEVLSGVLSIEERHKQKLIEEGKALNDLKAKYDPLFAAMQKYKKTMAELNVLKDKGMVSEKFYANAVKETKRALRESLDVKNKIKEANAKEAKTLSDLRARYDTLYAAEQRYAKAQADLLRLRRAGVITKQQEIRLIAEATRRRNEETGATERNIGAVRRLTLAIREAGFLTTAWAGYVRGLRFAWKVFFGLTVAKTVGNWAIGFAKAGESVELLGKKLKFLTGESDALGKVANSARKVGIDLDTLNKTITRFAITAKGAFNVKEMLSWTEALVKSGRVAGTTNSELQSGLLQLSQSLSAGRLMGDEYRSISENLPLLKIELQKIFEEMGMGNIALKKLSSQGLITNDILIEAFQNLGKTVEGMPGSIGTIDSAISSLSTEVKLFIAEMTKGGSVVHDVIKSISESLRSLRQSIFGAIEGEDKLNDSIADSTLGTDNFSKSVKRVNEEIKKGTEITNEFLASIFGVNNAMASASDSIEETSVSMTLLGTAMSVIMTLFAGGIVVKLASFVARVAGLGLAARGAGASLRFMSAGVSGLQASFLLAAVGLNKFFGILKSGVQLFKGFFTVAGATFLAYAAAIAYPIAAIVDHVEKLERLKVVHEESIDPAIAYAENIKSIKKELDGLNVKELSDRMSENGLKMVENSGYTEELRGRISELSHQISLAPDNVENLRDQMVVLINVMNQLSVANQNLALDTKLSADEVDNISISFEGARKKGQDFLDSLKNKQGLDKEFLEFSRQQEQTVKHFDDLKKSIQGITVEQAAWLDQMKGAALQRAAKAFDEASKSSKKAKKNINKLTQAHIDMKKAIAAGAGETQLAEIQKRIDKYSGLTAKVKALDKALKDSAKASDKLAKKEKKALEERIKLWEKFNPDLATYLNEAKSLAKALKQGVITEKEFNKQLKEQQKLLKLNTGKMSDYEEAIEGWNSGLKKFSEEAQDYYSQMDSFAQKTMNSMTDALTEFVTTGKLDFASLVDSIVADLTRIAIQGSITGPLAEVLGIGGGSSGGGGGSAAGGLLGGLLGGGGGGTANTLTAGGGGFGGMLSNAAMMFGFKNGGAFNNGVQAFASGGVVNSPTLFPMANGAGLMGEAGAEAVMPLKRTSSGKLGVEASGGSSTNIVININVAGTNGDSDAIRRSAGQVAQAAGQATSRAMRRNG